MPFKRSIISIQLVPITRMYATDALPGANQTGLTSVKHDAVLDSFAQSRDKGIFIHELAI
eukprot:scaffold375132_cov36-Prasinocladus_malaysianus.AAC.1